MWKETPRLSHGIFFSRVTCVFLAQWVYACTDIVIIIEHIYIYIYIIWLPTEAVPIRVRFAVKVNVHIYAQLHADVVYCIIRGI